MFHAADLPKTIPVFPLMGTIVLPRLPLPLHIFEPRYLTMFDDAIKTTHRLIGMVQPTNSSENAPIHDIGCAGRVTSFSETNDGKYMVTLTGVSRFRVAAEQEGFTAYKRCDVDWAEFQHDLKASAADPEFDRGPFLELLSRFFSARELESDWDALKGADEELLVNSLSMLCPFEPEDKQALLEVTTLTERRETLTTLLDFALRGGASEEIMQ